MAIPDDSDGSMTDNEAILRMLLALDIKPGGDGRADAHSKAAIKRIAALRHDPARLRDLMNQAKNEE